MSVVRSPVSLVALSFFVFYMALHVTKGAGVSVTAPTFSHAAGLIRTGTEDRCSKEGLEEAAKCKCFLLGNALPEDDFKVAFCKTAFQRDLATLRRFCPSFYGNAVAHKSLIAMFEIEKLRSDCFQCDRTVSRTLVKAGSDSTKRGRNVSLSPRVRAWSVTITIIIYF